MILIGSRSVVISIGNKKLFIVEVHLLIRPRQWTSALRVLQARLAKLDRTETSASLVPLYYSYDFEDLEIRICFLYADVRPMERYIVNSLRSINGVTATRVRLTLNGEIFPGGFQALMVRKKNFFSAHIFIKTDPVYDHSVWEKLRILPKSKDVYPAWIFRDFYEYDRDVTLRVIGKTMERIRHYLEKYLNRIVGIRSWRLKIMREFVTFKDKAFLTKLATHFLPD